MEEELTEVQKDSILRIIHMSARDIYDMPDVLLCKLIDYFDNELLIRLAVSRGQDKVWQQRMSQRLKDAHKWWYIHMDPNEKIGYSNSDKPREHASLFKTIDYDIACNRLIEAPSVAFTTPAEPWEQDIDPYDALVASHTEDISMFKACIKELEEQVVQVTAENEALKKQLEECRNQPQASDMQEVSSDDWIVELLSHLMYESEQNAKAFLEKIRNINDAEITDTVAEWVRDKKISSKSCRRDLWRILHAAKLYEGTESNYNTAMRNKQ